MSKTLDKNPTKKEQNGKTDKKLMKSGKSGIAKQT